MLMSASTTKQRLTMAAKLALAAAILAYLLHQVGQQDGFSRLVDQEKNWGMLALGVGCIFASVTLSFVRWYILVRALELDFRLIDALRLGAIGFALNFVALGNVGGDVFKAVFIARSQPGRRTAAVTTIAVDRAVGLFTFLVLASAAVVLMDLGGDPATTVAVLCRLTLITTAVGATAILLVLFHPGFTGDWLVRLVGRVPLIGAIGVQFVAALAAYRDRKRQLLAAFLLSVVVDTFFIVSMYLVASGLPIRVPTLGEHFLVVPLALVAGSIPITPSGLGTLELAVNALYQVVPSGVEIVDGTGTIVTLAHRVGMMIVASIGVLFYASQRSRRTADAPVAT